MMQNGSVPAATAAGNGMSGGSWDTSSSQASVEDGALRGDAAEVESYLA
jgi:hypothetical protein